MSDKPFRILIVEDDRFLLKIYSTKLSKAGYEVIFAIEGDEALRKINDEKPNLILLDIILPGKNGFEILSEMRSQKSTQNIPVIILSNLGQEEDIVRGKELGVKEYLVKSNHSLKEVMQKISEVIAKIKIKKS
ncbi:MAG: response regulator [Parcubacteria group bacterium]|nr:response regulator [Parcubacteria group bacterium]